MLVERQHDLGIPTWRDVDDLDEAPTEDAIRAALADSETANAVMWLTPDVATSPMIRRVEVPAILSRHRREDAFFVVPVAAGGLDYVGAAEVVEGDIGVEDLSRWNIRRISSDPATEEDINQIATRVLSRRLAAVHDALPHEASLTIILNTRSQYTAVQQPGLLIDWTNRFDGRTASDPTWQNYLLPALREVSRQVLTVAPGRTILASGLLSIPAATALGYHFMAPMQVNISWQQHFPGGSTQAWNLSDEREPSSFGATLSAGNPEADDLAILVSVNADVAQAVADTVNSQSRFRAYVHVRHSGGESNRELNSSGQAVDVARCVIEAARAARERYVTRGRVHLFMAVPVGLAMLIGQLLNTLGQIQTYEHIPDGATGYYVPAALLGT